MEMCCKFFQQYIYIYTEREYVTLLTYHGGDGRSHNSKLQIFWCTSLFIFSLRNECSRIHYLLPPFLSFTSHWNLQQQGTRLFTRNAFILLLHEWVRGSSLLYIPSDGAPLNWQIWWILVCAKKKSLRYLNFLNWFTNIFGYCCFCPTYKW